MCPNQLLTMCRKDDCLTTTKGSCQAMPIANRLPVEAVYFLSAVGFGFVNVPVITPVTVVYAAIPS
jgi:hypothetical protein